MAMVDELEYYLGYRPDDDTCQEAEAWQEENPEVALAEWCSAMEEAGLL